MTYGDTLTALAHPTRRAIFQRLRRSPAAVGELAREFPVSQPAVSQHLRVLREAGLVSRLKEGNRRVYRVRREGVAELRAYVESLWDDALGAFKESTEKGGDA